MEVLKFLQDARKKSDKFYTKPEVASGLKKLDIPVNGLFDDLHRLALFNFIDMTRKGKPWNIKFLWRAKKGK